MKRFVAIAIACVVCVVCVEAQDSTGSENIRKGWTFGVLPSFAYDADLGLQLGVLSNVYYFGDGAVYPDYYHSFFAEVATTSKHYGLFRFAYDSKYLIPKHRLSIDLTYMPDQMCDFYGFNGYESEYVEAYTDSDSPEYITRAYYKMKRDLFRFSGDLQGEISKPWYWNVGLGLLWYNIGSVDVDRLNKYTKNEVDELPDTATLYDIYRYTGGIKDDEAEGGVHPYIHAGITYDTRNRQQNPERGIYADALFSYYAALGNMSDYNNVKFNANWRQYIKLGTPRVILAYRLGTQLNVAGESPFYLNTYINQLYMQRVIYEGLGGANSIRGIMRNRILARGVVYANAELRLQVARFKIGKELFYIGLNPFMDAGMVAQPYEDYMRTIEPTEAIENSRLHDLHLSAGCGLKVAMNENFVLSVDWATALDKQDNGKVSNLYIKMGYMF